MPDVTTPPGELMYNEISFFRFEEKQLRDDQRRHAVFDRAGDEDDAFFEQPRENVVGPLAAIGLFDHHRHQVHVSFDRVTHRLISSTFESGPI
jgi:hypothetical protein